MASYRSGYDTAVELREGPIARSPREAFARLLHWLFEQLSTWLAPKLRRLGKALFAELVRGVFTLAALGFALIAALYGASYLFEFAVEALGHWLPHWAALLVTAAAMLIPAGLAALLALWQLSRMRTVRATAMVTTQLGAAIWAFTRRDRTRRTEF